jgi:hypothetical protein
MLPAFSYFCCGVYVYVYPSPEFAFCDVLIIDITHTHSRQANSVWSTLKTIVNTSGIAEQRNTFQLSSWSDNLWLLAYILSAPSQRMSLAQFRYPVVKKLLPRNQKAIQVSVPTSHESVISKIFRKINASSIAKGPSTPTVLSSDPIYGVHPNQ